MNIKENDIIYYKNNFELAIKYIEKGDILIEIETEPNTKWETVENIKSIISEINLPIEKDNYFIKKAEIELNKILKRQLILLNVITFYKIGQRKVKNNVT